jgi:Undecaprenyl-phosphate galactose phosphotransferase WbaP
MTKKPVPLTETPLLLTKIAVAAQAARLAMTAALLLADGLGLGASLALAQVGLALAHLPFDKKPAEFVLLLAGVLVLLFIRKQLYPGQGRTYSSELGQLISTLSFGFLLVLVIFQALEDTSLVFLVNLGLTWLFSLVLVPAARYILRAGLIRAGFWGEPVAVLGQGPAAETCAAFFNIKLQLGLRPVILLTHEPCPGCDPLQRQPGAVCELTTRAGQLGLQTALVVLEDLNELDLLVERYRPAFQRLILVKNKAGRHALTSLEVFDFSELIGLQVKNNLQGYLPRLLKRLIDLLGAGLGMIGLAPFFGLLALLIRLDSPGGVFYRQTRLGRDGRPFQLLKFRTMVPNAEQYLAVLLETNPLLRAEWETHQKLKSDPRLTRLGRWLRKFSLDELPQLWNIWVGEMSLVGPRPMLPEQRPAYGETFAEIAQLRPGLTGLWQVSGRNETTFATRAALDYEYIQNWSLWLDIFILFKTLKEVFWPKGAF